LGRNKDAVLVKAKRLGVRVVVGDSLTHTTSELVLPAELISPEEALKVLVSALQASKQPGLDKVEVQRLMAVATLARTYDGLLEKYVGYRKIEQKLVELEKYADLAQRERGRASDSQTVETGKEQNGEDVA